MTDPVLDRALPSEETPTGYVIRMSRPRFWFYLAGPVIVGVAYAATSTAELFAPLTVALFAYFLLPANVFLYGVNDVFDADVDAENPKKDEREVRYQGGRLVPALVAVSGVLGLAFLPFLPPAGVVGMVAFLLLSVEYSAPPLRFKTTPFLDSLSNGLYILPGVVAYSALAGTAPPLFAIAGAWLWAMGMHTFSAIPDIEPDREAGIQTTATVLGESRTYGYCALCWVAAAAVFALVHPFFGALLAVYPVFVTTIALADVDVARAYWWFPALNTAVGMVFTLAALWVMLYG
ncbi:MAG: 4-hydroxybenzoate polyprenyltransferase [Natronomonas sp.]|jgi:4-hydroxybenzoate polyprenyltransferase|uniref:prenyltransferase n=1 Tax=Natronomonas sp. TaxID=2184060 RepID=UPI0039E54E48